jgi:hypothetical protein
LDVWNHHFFTVAWWWLRRGQQRLQERVLAQAASRDEDFGIWAMEMKNGWTAEEGVRRLLLVFVE